jgi:hypothetical protein
MKYILTGMAFAIHFGGMAQLNQPDYTILQNWAAHPLKKDMADSVPKSLKKDYTLVESVDIFFIHPTTYTQSNKEYGQNAPIDNPILNNKTNAGTILFQASIFNAAGRVFAPYYRQAHISSYFPVSQTDTIEAKEAFELAYNDIKKAFENFLQVWNEGRPIIIASHSQGTTHAKRLMKEFFDGKPLQQKLVAAYLVGMPVEPNWFSNINSCVKPNQTGCYCSWRTYRKDYKPDYVEREKYVATVTNPLSWDIDKPTVSRSENRGSILRNFNKTVEWVVGAEVSGGVLWTERPRFFGSILYTTKNYHIADFNFYYLSVRENASLRVASFLRK